MKKKTLKKAFEKQNKDLTIAQPRLRLVDLAVKYILFLGFQHERS